MTAELPWDWTAEETARMGAMAERVAEAFPERDGYQVGQLRTIFDELTGLLLPPERWRWHLSLEWMRGDRAHYFAYEAETLGQAEARLDRWIADAKERT